MERGTIRTLLGGVGGVPTVRLFRFHFFCCSGGAEWGGRRYLFCMLQKQILVVVYFVRVVRGLVFVPPTPPRGVKIKPQRCMVVQAQDSEKNQSLIHFGTVLEALGTLWAPFF